MVQLHQADVAVTGGNLEMTRTHLKNAGEVEDVFLAAQCALRLALSSGSSQKDWNRLFSQHQDEMAQLSGRELLLLAAAARSRGAPEAAELSAAARDSSFMEGDPCVILDEGMDLEDPARVDEALAACTLQDRAAAHAAAFYLLRAMPESSERRAAIAAQRDHALRLALPGELPLL